MLSSCKHFIGHIGIVHYMTVFIGINSLFSVFVYKHSVLAYINLSAVFVLYMYSVCKADVYLVAVFRINMDSVFKRYFIRFYILCALIACGNFCVVCAFLRYGFLLGFGF